MNNPIIIGLLAWVIPGAGHLVQKRVERGIIIAAVVWIMFVIAIISGGAHYPGFAFKDGALLYLLNVFARFGNVLGAIVSFIMAGTPSPNAAAAATFEYGGRFLEVAGLLNYLAVIDAIDIAYGRKK
jgi:TM2 domain-containing membrane protein YozV